MLIKKDEEPFFYKFLAIAKEIIKKNPKYTPVFYGDDERLYLACGNHAAVYDFQSNLLLDDELREFGKIPYELSELPNGDMKLTKSEHFSCQESYLIAIRNFFKHTGYMSKKVFSVDKGDPYKIPKIVEVTQRWISEEDNKILDKIGFPDIYMLDAKRVDEFEDMDVEEPADDEQEEIIEDDYQEEEQLDALLEDTVVPEELEDDFDPMLA